MPETPQASGFFFLLTKFKIKFMWRFCPCHKNTTRNTEPERGGEKRIACDLRDLHASRLEKEPSKIPTDRAILGPLHPGLFLTSDEAQLFCSSLTKSQLKKPIKPQPVRIFMPFTRSQEHPVVLGVHRLSLGAIKGHADTCLPAPD